MSKYSVKKPVTVLMCILIVIVLGVYSLTKQSLGLFPEMNLPYVVVVTPYAGASAEDVAEDVTSVVESQVTSMNNFANVSSTSNQHYSIVMVEFNDGTNMDSVMIDLRSKLDNITFKEGVTKPTILQISPDMLPVMSVSVSVDYPEEKDEEQAFIKASQYVNSEIIDRLSRVEGVAEVSTTGSADVVIKVDLDTTKISSYGYTTEQILDLVEEQNQDKLIGVALNDGEICMLHLGNSIENIEELKNLPLPVVNPTTGENEVVLLKDFAKEDGIKFIDNNAESYSKVNGKKTISLSFQMQNGATITDVTKGITKVLDEICEENKNFSYSVVLDQGEYINLAVGSVVENLIYGAILAIIVLLIFLKDFRPTLIVGLSIPISVIATFMCMYFMDINLNMLSMGGLALGIGMLVDNAIVVIENIFRLRKEGKSKVEAAIEGAKGVAGAITASTITTIIVFVPILFLGGTVKDVFANMAYTISFSLICSLVISLTMVPAMASKILKDDKTETNEEVKEENKEENKEETKVENLESDTKEVAKIEKESKIMTGYEKVIKWSLNHKLVVILIPVVLFLVTFVLTVSKGFVLLPTTDEGSISANVVVNSDLEYSVVSKYTDKLADDILESSDEIETVSASFGSSSGMLAMVAGSSNTDITNISITVKLDADHKKSTEDHAKDINELIKKFNVNDNLILYGMSEENIINAEVEASESAMSAITASGINIKVKGYDLEKMEAVATKIAEIAAKVEGTKDVSSGVKGSQNNLKIYVNKLNAAKQGLTQEDFVESVNLFLESDGLSLTTGSDTTTLNFNGISYDISLPSNMSIEGFNLANLMTMFGSYEEFLEGFVVFDRKTIAEIKSSGKSLYSFIPLDKDGNEILDFSDPNIMLSVKSLKVSVDLGYYLTPELDENNQPVLDENNQPKYVKNYISFFEMNAGKKMIEGMLANPNLPAEQVQQLSMQLAGINYILQSATSYEDVAKGKLMGDENDVNHLSLVKPVTGYTSISSDGNYRYFSVKGSILNSHNVTKVSNEVTELVNDYLESEEFAPYKDIVQVEFVGESEEIMNIVEEMIIALLIGVLLVYMVIAIQFQSLLYPLIILGTLPLAFTGGFAFILIFNVEFSIVAIMGLIVLVGVAVNNGIVLIDYVNQLREAGYTVRDACVKASMTRLRPILMTSITTIVALIFSAIGMSNGSELLQPLSLTSIGGLLFSTILTLIVIPAIYMAINYKTVKKEDEEQKLKEN